MSDRRCVLDTNIVISALMLPHSKPALVLTAALTDGQALQSNLTLAELNEVFLRDKFNKYLTHLTQYLALGSKPRANSHLETSKEVVLSLYSTRSRVSKPPSLGF